jgi:hypothetical protein
MFFMFLILAIIFFLTVAFFRITIYSLSFINTFIC